MRKCFVCLCHFMSFLAFFYRVSFIVECIKNFICNSLSHCFFISFGCWVNYPFHCQGLSSSWSYFHWHLICSTSNSSRSNFKTWFNITKCFVKKIYFLQPSPLSMPLCNTQMLVSAWRWFPWCINWGNREEGWSGDSHPQEPIVSGKRLRRWEPPVFFPWSRRAFGRLNICKPWSPIRWLQSMFRWPWTASKRHSEQRLIVRWAGCDQVVLVRLSRDRHFWITISWRSCSPR